MKHVKIEKIINRCLFWFLETNGLISNSQYGCLNGRSTSMAQAELDALIHDANSNNASLYSIFFDLENASPKIWQRYTSPPPQVRPPRPEFSITSPLPTTNPMRSLRAPR